MRSGFKGSHFGVAALLLLLPTPVLGQASSLSPEVRSYVSVDAPVVALTHVQLIDGTGTPAVGDQTILIDNGRITEVGLTESVRIPRGVRVLGLQGHTVIPGIVGLHNHTWYIVGGSPTPVQLQYSAPRMYLAGGVTTIRTTGSTSPYAELNLKGAIERGEVPGPRMHVTGPYIIGPGPEEVLRLVGMHEVASQEAARRVVAYWAEEGATWIKVYTQITRAMLSAVIDEAHKHGMKVTGHLCSITYREAVDLGMDNIEHGLLTATDFDPQKTADVCPESLSSSITRVGDAADVSSDRAKAVVTEMVEHGVSMTSTLAVWELFVPGRPTKKPRVLEMMAPNVRNLYLDIRRQVDAAELPGWREYFRKALAFERMFVESGGMLVAGADPTGYGGALPGFADQRNYELLVEAGLAPEQVIQIMTANGAQLLGELDRLGTVTRGKLADLVVIRGDPVRHPSDIQNVSIVFKDGIGYDPVKLLDAVRGTVGER